MKHEDYEQLPSIKSFKGTKSKEHLFKDQFLVKVQAGQEGDIMGGGVSSKIEDSMVMVYDKSRTVNGRTDNEKLFEIVRQYGKLGSELNYSKRIFLHARIHKENVDFIQVHTDRLVHDQDW